MLPHNYTAEKSINVLEKSKTFLKKNPKFKKEIEELSWTYYSMGNTIPQTTENFWSGHFFPFKESFDELQISFNLAMFGLYKQAFASLRSGLELGFLSIYYNINDDGHKAVQEWLKSKNTWEANTPKTNTIWKILSSNQNIKNFNKRFGLRERFDKLSFLHNYVHTKGGKYSNQFGVLKSNFQTFEENMFIKWINTYREISIIITTLHLLKYPIGVLKFDWSTKCGIDNPFPVLGEHEIEKVERLLPREYMEELEKIAAQDTFTQELYDYIQNLPDMTRSDIDKQIIDFDKSMIEHHPRGFNGWEKQEKNTMKVLKFNDEEKKKTLSKIKKLKKWAIENNMMGPKM